MHPGEDTHRPDAERLGNPPRRRRSFTRKSPHQYDLAIYALVDSLVLHSGYSSIRLENFLFTEEAFRDIKSKLKPGGVFAMYNYYRQGWVVGRLAIMAKKVFGVDPIVISLGQTFQGTIAPKTIHEVGRSRSCWWGRIPKRWKRSARPSPRRRTSGRTIHPRSTMN